VPQSAEDKALVAEAKGYCDPIPSLAPPDAAQQRRIALGKQLFYDPRLSQIGTASCASCHQLKSYGIDRRPVATGHGIHPHTRNVQTVLNATLHQSQFWDGRATGPEALSRELILTTTGGSQIVLTRLGQIPAYRQAFGQAFSGRDPLSFKNISLALTAFEGTLLTPAPFDRFLHGEGSALDGQQKQGLKLFMDYGCIACHGGPSFGGGMFQKFGMLKPYAHQGDTGRFQLTGKAEDKYVFKVPSLRNVVMTAPYFHDGQVASLKQVIATMDQTQLGQNLKPETIDKIAAFLQSLTGEIPAAALTPPELPGVAKPDH